jgi:glycosyltransferase involved in cell wall biosynthesis
MVDYAILIASRHWPDVAERAIVSIRQFSDAPIVLVDDASPDEKSKAGYEKLWSKYNIALGRASRWLQHGLALDLALFFTGMPWVITCDHDVIVNEERALTMLLERAADDVGAVGRMYNNAACAEFGTYVHPHWALWNADAIRRYSLSFRSFSLRRKSGSPYVFATGQFLSYQLQTIGKGDPSWAAPGTPLQLVAVNLGKAITHAQVKERGEAWHQKVKL